MLSCLRSSGASCSSALSSLRRCVNYICQFQLDHRNALASQLARVSIAAVSSASAAAVSAMNVQEIKNGTGLDSEDILSCGNVFTSQLHAALKKCSHV